MLQRISAKSSANSEVKSINRECSVSHASMNSFSRKKDRNLVSNAIHIEDLKILNFSRGRPPTPLRQREGGNITPLRRNPPPPHSRAGNIIDLAVNVSGTSDDNVQTVAILIKVTNIIVCVSHCKFLKEFGNQGMFDMRKPAMQLCATRNLRSV